MVMNGRYAVLYGKLSPKEQQDVLSKMAELIEEEKEYEDKGNYGHLCNILPTIAIDEALQKKESQMKRHSSLFQRTQTLSRLRR